MRYHYKRSAMAKKSESTTQNPEDPERAKGPGLGGGTQDGAASQNKSLAVSYKVSQGPGNHSPTPRCFLRRKENTCPHKDLHTTIQSSRIHNAKNWEQPKCPPTRRITKPRATHPVEQDSAINRRNHDYKLHHGWISEALQ